MKVFGRVGYQPACEIKCDAASTPVSKVKTLAAEALSVADPASAHVALVSAGRDVLVLTGSTPDIKDQSVPLAKAVPGVDVITVVFTLPNAKPIRRRPKAKPEKADAPVDSKDKFGGLTPDSVLTQLESTKDKKRREVLLSYIDAYTTKVLESKNVAKLSKSNMKAILERDTLNAKEVDLFDWLVRWGKLTSGASEGAKLQAALSDVIPQIRFPLMSTKDIAVKVSPLGVLSMPQQLELFSYMGQKEAGASPSLGESISKFKTEKRKGAGFVEIVWDFGQSWTSGCYTAQGTKTAYKNRSGFIAILREASPRSTGSHRFRLTWEGVGAENAWSNGRDGIGFCLDSYNCSSYYLASGSGAACYDPYRKQVYIDSSEQPGSLPPISVGTEMDFGIDLDKGEVEFFGTKYPWPTCKGRNVYVALCFNAEGWRFTSA